MTDTTTTARAVDPPPTLDEFLTAARAWLVERFPRRIADKTGWGVGSDDVSVFHSLDPAAEAALVTRAQQWHQTKYDAGYASISEPIAHGGSGLPSAYARGFRKLEATFDIPPSHEVLTVTSVLVAGAIRLLGTDEQKTRFGRSFSRASEICCQLFSEPGAGSDLANVTTKAVRDGDDWVITGQKVWSSGAQFAQWGIVLCRTDPSAPKHQGMTMFLVPMNAEGIGIRPIRQMTGGGSFNEVFLDGVRIPDTYRVGAESGGWRAAVTVLGFERGGGEARGGTYREVLALARWTERVGDPQTRQELAKLYTERQITAITARRAAQEAARAGRPGPQGSIIKLLFTRHQQSIAAVVASLLGPRLLADTKEWGTFAWADFLLGAPGNRIAGGTDETQRNIIGERVLGLPAEPRSDKDGPFRPST